MTTLTRPEDIKITYSSTQADLEDFHRLFDEALALVKSRLGGSYPLFIEGKAVKSSLKPIIETSPIDTALVLGKFAAAGPKHLAAAVAAARKAQKAWGDRPWAERLAVLRASAQAIRRRKFEIAAMMSLEVGKNRLEAMGDVEESADLIDYYAQQMEDAKGFERPMGRLSPNERTSSVLRPYGVFLCISPFNFPMALSAGMSSAALMAGNSIVYKPAPATPWSGLFLYECYREGGLPDGLFNFLPARLEDLGEKFWKRPDLDGIVFTGSRDVGLRMVKEFPDRYPKPVLMEGGGKNAAIVTASADLDLAAEGVMKSAFGLQGQKCSACSRVYVDKAVAATFIQKLVAKTRALKIGDPTRRDVYLGPVISDRAIKTFEGAVKSAKKGGKILHGGRRLKEGVLAKGRFVEPTIAQLPLGHELFTRELFVPFTAVGLVSGLDQAISEANKVDYGLTAGIFSSDKAEIDRFFNEVQAGVCYANRRAGATTGAWPGVQSFCGWKGSGSTGKGGCGPYYVAQFMREQSRTVIE